jgi:two-component system CheB/CheR fusion protein
LMRIMPYRTAENVVDGLSITFLDIHELKTAAEKIEKQSKLTQDAVAYAEDIIDTVREPLLVLDEKLRVSSANRSFYETFQVSSKQTVGQLIYDLGNRQWDIPKLRQLLEDIVPKNASFEGFEVDHEFPGVGFKRMLLNARKVFRSTKEKELVLLAMEDVSPK